MSDDYKALRAAINDALRLRKPDVLLLKKPTEDRRALWVVMWPGAELSVRGYGASANRNALCTLASVCGLVVDGDRVIDPSRRGES